MGVQMDDPGADSTGTADNGVAGVVLGGDYTDTGGAFYYLTSPVIDASFVTGSLDFSFQRWLTSDYMSYVFNNVEVFDGASWVVIWQGSPGWISDVSWNLYSIDITPFANANLRVRIGFQTNGGFISDGGWNVDDVTITEY